jgi:hypothetical protein
MKLFNTCGQLYGTLPNDKAKFVISMDSTVAATGRTRIVVGWVFQPAKCDMYFVTAHNKTFYNDVLSPSEGRELNNY